MATKRQRGSGSWEFIFRRKGLLPRPVSLTFSNEKEGDQFAARAERLLDLGIVPSELSPGDEGPLNTVGKVIRAYRAAVAVPPSDDTYLDTLGNELGMKPMSEISFDWAEEWVTDMKRHRGLAPSTIRHRVGALARCFDWAGRKERVSAVVVNPLRLLTKRYASYSDTDAQHAEAHGQPVPGSGIRDRRLEPEEDKRIRAVMAGEKPDGRQRPLELKYQAALECLYDLALESAMRLREMYTLELQQMDIARRTVFLDRTKNGSKRQVPLTSVACAVLRTYFDFVKKGTHGMEGFAHEGGRLFPWFQPSAPGKNPVLHKRELQAELRRATSLLSRQYARIFDAAGCVGLDFHDLRREATCRLYERTELSDVEIARITGHKDLRMLANRYANLRGSNLAKKMC